MRTGEQPRTRCCCLASVVEFMGSDHHAKCLIGPAYLLVALPLIDGKIDQSGEMLPMRQKFGPILLS